MILIDSEIEKLAINNGKNLDKEFSSMIYTIKDSPRHFKNVFNFKCINLRNWDFFAKDNDGGIYFDGEQLFAVFLNQELPFYRFYFFCTENTTNLSILINKYNATEFKYSKVLKTIEDPFSIKKYDEYIKAQKEGFLASTVIAEGRNNNTTIDQSIIVRREPDGCFVCGKKSTGYVSTIITVEKTKFIIADICDEHKEDVKKYKCVLDYIFQTLGSHINLPDNVQEEKINVNILEYIYDEIETKLDVIEQKDKRQGRIKKGEYEYTATFKSSRGFSIYIRLKTLMDYGYVINYPNRKQFKRIDSENHHNKILDFGPDHIHNKPEDEITIQRKEKTIKSSYTTGFPLYDLPSIKKMLSDAEKKWDEMNSTIVNGN